MSILNKLADLIKKQRQLEERLNQLEIQKTQARPVLSSLPQKVDLSKYEVQAREMLTQAREEAANIREEAGRIKEEALRLKNESLQKEAEIDRKVGAVDERERLLTQEKADLEKICEKVHQAYCKYHLENRGTEYWTKGDYSKLNEEGKEYDRRTDSKSSFTRHSKPIQRRKRRCTEVYK